jgi:EmrB/QacA subfamily drug resistance transporter
MRKWLPLIAICLGTFMLLVDVTIVNVALPDIASGLHASLSSLEWVIDGYAITLAALLLALGGVADRVGYRTIYVAGMAVFAVASLTSGLSPDATVLVAARVVQGIGGAAMLATTFALIDGVYSNRDRGVAYGIWGAVSGVSSAVGPLLGGLLTQGFSWRWIFFVNLPVSAIAIIACLVVLPKAHVQSSRRIDVGGVALFTAAIASLTFGMIRADDRGWGDPLCWSALIVGGTLMLGFIVVEIRVSDPLLDLGLLRNFTFSGVLVAAVLLNFTAYVAFAYSSIWLQSVLHLTPIAVGLIGLPMGLAAFVVSAALGRAMHRLRPRFVISGGLLLIAVGDLLAFGLVYAWGSWPALLPGFFVIGLGVGLATPTLSSTGMTAVPAARGGMAAGAVNTARQVGYAFGIAILGTFFTAGVRNSLIEKHIPAALESAREVADGRSAQLLKTVSAHDRVATTHAIAASAAAGMEQLFFVAGSVGVVAAVITFVMIRGRSATESPN